MRRPKFKINEPAFQDWVTKKYGEGRGRMARFIDDLKPYAISSVSMYEYLRGESEPPLIFVYALAVIDPELNFWSLLKKTTK